MATHTPALSTSRLASPAGRRRVTLHRATYRARQQVRRRHVTGLACSWSFTIQVSVFSRIHCLLTGFGLTFRENRTTPQVTILPKKKAKEEKTSEPKKLGSYLVVSQGTINSAIERQIDAYTKGRPVKRLGEILREMEVITQEDLDTAIRLQRIDRLSRCPLFSELPTADLAALSKHFQEVSVPPGEQFITQGKNDPTLFVIASGRVEVFSLDNTGREVSIADVGEGEPIGEMGYFSGGIRTASVRTLEPVQLLRAEYRNLTNYFENVPYVALTFTQVVNRRRKELEQLTKFARD